MNTYMKRLLAITLGMFALAIPAAAQGPFPPLGDDATTSLGSFKIRVANKFTSLFNGCPAYNPTTKILSSPTLFDPQTIIGRSNVVLDDSPFRLGSVPTGTARTVIGDDTLIQPPGFPCFGDKVSCASGPGTRQVHTEVRALKMTGGGMTVRAGMWYNEPPFQGYSPQRVSPGKVQSKSGPSNDPTRDFIATSFFDVYAKVDVPACGGFPGTTLYNALPLTVQNPQVDHFPPKVVYLHDASSIVPILFLYDNGSVWNKDDVLGYFVLAGHGVGYGNSQSDMDAFNSIMNAQSNASCPIGP